MLKDNYPYIRKEYYTSEEAIKILSKAKMYENLKKAVKRYGLEGTEDIIKINYNTIPKMREILLETLYSMWRK